jgi:hypothetical protein
VSAFADGRRLLALGLLLVLLVAYGALAEDLPGLPSGLDIAFHSAVVFPAFAAALWLALPLARAGTVLLVAAAGVAGIAAVALTLAGVGSGANVAKLAAYALLGFAFLSLFEELWWVTLVTVIVPWADVWSVATGPTRYVVEEQPGLFERLAVAFPSPGETATVNIGPPDILFFALLLAAAERFGLRVAWTWLAMTALLAVTLVLVWTWDDAPGLPALPAVCLGFVVANGDLLWRDARSAWAARTRSEPD